MDGKIKRLHYGDVMIELPYEIECDKKVFKLYSMEQQMIAMLWYAIKNVMEEIVKIQERENIGMINQDSMSDSIDRDDTLKIIADTISLYGTGTKVESEILSVVSKIPSAEPKTAVWVGEGDGYADGEIVLDTWYCSNCNYLYDYDEKPDWNYCPHCGAKMEEE